MTTLENVLRNGLEPFKADWFKRMLDWSNEHYDKAFATYAKWEIREKKFDRIIGHASVKFRCEHWRLFDKVLDACRKEEKKYGEYLWMRAWKNRKDEWMAREEKHIAEEWESNVQLLIKKCTKFNIDESKAKVHLCDEISNGFEVNISDGKDRLIKARMIWAAKYSVLVRPHVRYIITERKIK
jgi:hypothetical protein